MWPLSAALMRNINLGLESLDRCVPIISCNYSNKLSIMIGQHFWQVNTLLQWHSKRVVRWWNWDLSVRWKLLVITGFCVSTVLSGCRSCLCPTKNVYSCVLR